MKFSALLTGQRFTKIDPATGDTVELRKMTDGQDGLGYAQECNTGKVVPFGKDAEVEATPLSEILGTVYQSDPNVAAGRYVQIPFSYDGKTDTFRVVSWCRCPCHKSQATLHEVTMPSVSTKAAWVFIDNRNLKRATDQRRDHGRLPEALKSEMFKALISK